MSKDCPAMVMVRGAAWLAIMGMTLGPVHADELGWLEGCWQTESGRTREVWVRGADTLLFGHNVATRAGAVTFFEQLRLEKGDGGWRYVAYPRGEAPTVFNEAAAGPDMLDVRAPDHDYPQRIIYRREGGALTATVSLIDGSDHRTWQYQSCGT